MVLFDVSFVSARHLAKYIRGTKTALYLRELAIWVEGFASELAVAVVELGILHVVSA